MRVRFPNYILDAIGKLVPSIYDKWANRVSVVSQDNNSTIIDVPEAYSTEFLSDLRKVLRDYAQYSGFALFIMPYRDYNRISSVVTSGIGTPIVNEIKQIYNKWASRVIVGADATNVALFLLIPSHLINDFLRDYRYVMSKIENVGGYTSRRMPVRKPSYSTGGILSNPYALIGLGLIGVSVFIIMKKKREKKNVSK